MAFDILSDGPSIMHATTEELGDWMHEGFASRRKRFGDSLFCFSPTAYPYKIKDHRQRSSSNFISLSVTGTACSLRCEHCDGRLLKGMEPTLTPDALFNRCAEVKELGGEGVLISGGSNSMGHVPLVGFTDAIARVKAELGLQVVVHTGLVDEETAGQLADAQIDAAMLDIIGDNEVSSRVYHIEDGPAKMRSSLRILEAAGIPTVPHILVGLNYGQLGGELEALQIIAEVSPAGVVIIVLSPIPKTPMATVAPPRPIDVGRVMTIARLGFGDTPLLLGCARPKGEHKKESDKLAIDCGANGIALISQDGVDHARNKGLNPIFVDVCCSLIFPHLM